MIDLTGDGGVLKEVRQVGSGDPVPADRPCGVSTHYVGLLVDGGSIFDSSRRHMDGGFCFNIGGDDATHHGDATACKLTKGLRLAVASMRVGESALVTCTSDYAFGEVGIPLQSGTGLKVPPNASVKYNVELLKILPYRKSAKEMRGSAEALDAAQASKARADDLLKAMLAAGKNKDEPQPTPLLASEGGESKGSASSSKGDDGEDEKAATSAAHREAGEGRGQQNGRGAPALSLPSSISPKPSALSAPKAAAAKVRFEDVTEAYEEALKFARAAEEAACTSDSGGDTIAADRSAVLQLQIACQLNLALAALHHQTYGSAQASATRALELLAGCTDDRGDESWVTASEAKAYFRRGCALRGLDRLDRAQQDLAKAARARPRDRQVRKALDANTKALAAQRQGSKGVFGGIIAKSSARGGLYADKKRPIAQNPEGSANGIPWSTTSVPQALLTAMDYAWTILQRCLRCKHHGKTE